MRPTFTLPQDPVLWEALLTGLAAVDEELFSRHVFPPLYEANIIYVPERGEHWQTALDMILSGEADCEDLVCWRVGRLNFHGEKARPLIYQSAPTKFHTVVEHENGEIEDPTAIFKKMGKSRPMKIEGEPMPEMKKTTISIKPGPPGFWIAELELPMHKGRLKVEGADVNPRLAARRAVVIGQAAATLPGISALSPQMAALMAAFPTGMPWAMPAAPAAAPAAPTGLAALLKMFQTAAPAAAPGAAPGRAA